MTDLKRLLLTKLELLRLFYDDQVDWENVQDFLVSVIGLSPHPEDRQWAEALLADDVYRIRDRVHEAHDALEQMSTYLQEGGRFAYHVVRPVAQVLTYSTVTGPLLGGLGVDGLLFGPSRAFESRMVAADEALGTRFFRRILENDTGPRSRQSLPRTAGPALEASVTLARLLWDTERRESDIGHPRITSISLRGVAMYASKVFHD